MSEAPEMNQVEPTSTDEQVDAQQQHNEASTPDSIFPENDDPTPEPQITHSDQPSESSVQPAVSDQMDTSFDEPKSSPAKPSGPFSMDDSDDEDEVPLQPNAHQARLPSEPSVVDTSASLPSMDTNAPENHLSPAIPAPESGPASANEPTVDAHQEVQNGSGQTAPPPNPLQNIDLQALLSKLSPTIAQQPSPSPMASVAQSAPAPLSSPPPKSAIPSIPPRPDLGVNTTARSPITSHASPSTLKGHASLPPAPHLVARQKQGSVASSVVGDDEEDRPFTEAEEHAYEDFLTAEREYVSKGQWDRFPPGSRLFIGNLPTEKVTKRDLFRIFSKHGRLAQISIKQAYGFIQFLDIQSCEAALRNEEGTPVRGRRMHLEVSKPQKNTRPAEGRGARSRSPDAYRGIVSPRSRGFGRDRDIRDRDPRGGSHYVPSAGRGGERSYRERDEYRRSPPPRFRGRDDYRPGRDRSRSRTPPSRYRSRSPPPDRFAPSRASHDVPEVQLIVSDRLEEDFIWFVRKPFMQRGIRNEVCYLSPRLSLDDIVRKMIIEGVLAVIILNNQSQNQGRVTLQVFDRSGGDSNIKFETYDGIEPIVAAEVVGRVKNTVSNAIPSFGAPPQHAPPYSAAPTFAQPPSVQPNAQIADLIRTMDPATLQTFLAAIQQNPHQLAQLAQLQQPQQQQQQSTYNQPAPSPSLSSQQQMQADLASLLAARGALPAAQPQSQQNQNQQGAYNQANYQANLANLLAQGGGGANGMPNLFDTLAHLKR